MKYSVIPGAFCLLFSLGIASAKIPVKLVISPQVSKSFTYISFTQFYKKEATISGTGSMLEELRQIVVELVKSEVEATLPARTAQALAVESQVQEQLVGIQQSIDETLRRHDVFRSDFDSQLEQIGYECRRAAEELAPAVVSNGGASNGSLFRDELQAIALDIVTIKESLQRVQANIQSQSTENRVATTESPTETIPFSTSPQLVTSMGRAFENAVAAKTVRIGKSFNGSNIDEISSVVSRTGFDGKFATVEFANFLNEAVTDFQLYHTESETPVYHLAPSLVAANTKEVFTFREPECCFSDVAFSFWIPRANIQIAARLDLRGGVNEIGLAFLSRNTSLLTYYDTKEGLTDAFDYREGPTSGDDDDVYPTTLQLLVKYQNWYAKATMLLRGHHKANVKIELVEVPE